MALELRQQLKLTQQLIMTPQLQMAIKLLQLSRLEMVDMINQELEQNPTLEEIIEPEQQDLSEKENADAKSTEEDIANAKMQSELDWSNYLDEFNSVGKTSFETERKDAPQYEAFIAKKENLKDHLLWQLLMSTPSEIEEMVGSQIIGNLDNNGYLVTPVEEIAQMCETDVEQVEDTLFLLQSFDPIGICARDLKECLLTQVKYFKLDSSILLDIISNHLKNLENKKYKEIARALKITLDDVISAVKIITELDPKPGRKFSDEEPYYINPDIFVYKHEDEFIITLNDEGIPRLHINQYYKNALVGKKKVTGETREYIREKMRSASWLIKSIHQRQKTIFRVMESILKFQRDFFEKGIAYLKPMVLKDVANDIEMHESTISRVTTNKYAFTPQGIFELKYFFNSSINRMYGEAIASASVQEKIRQIVKGENQKKPYSDSKIVELLKEENVDIARRTVAKYREMIGILPSNKRKQF